jgi:hypothetical protein
MVKQKSEAANAEIELADQRHFSEQDNSTVRYRDRKRARRSLAAKDCSLL